MPRSFRVIAAMGWCGELGKQGKLPWRLPDEMAWFKQCTTGNGNNAVIMGRKTWESIGSCPLKHRINFVVSSSLLKKAGKTLHFVSSLEEALEILDRMTAVTTIWVIGGGQLYQAALQSSRCESLWLSLIEPDHADSNCDTFFPTGWTGDSVTVERGGNHWIAVNVKQPRLQERKEEGAIIQVSNGYGQSWGSCYLVHDQEQIVFVLGSHFGYHFRVLYFSPHWRDPGPIGLLDIYWTFWGLLKMSSSPLAIEPIFPHLVAYTNLELEW